MSLRSPQRYKERPASGMTVALFLPRSTTCYRTILHGPRNWMTLRGARRNGPSESNVTNITTAFHNLAHIEDPFKSLQRPYEQGGPRRPYHKLMPDFFPCGMFTDHCANTSLRRVNGDILRTTTCIRGQYTTCSSDIGVLCGPTDVPQFSVGQTSWSASSAGQFGAFTRCRIREVRLTHWRPH